MRLFRKAASPKEEEWRARVVSACHEHPDVLLPELGQLLAMDEQKASPEAKWFAMTMVAQRIAAAVSVEQDEFQEFCEWLVRDVGSITKTVKASLPGR